MADVKISKTQRDDDEIKDLSQEMGPIAPSQSSQNIELIALGGSDFGALSGVAPEEPVKVRSKVRLLAIMTALNVGPPYRTRTPNLTLSPS